ncbi:putative inactive ATP-dependent zinc metalloprotease FTSHI 4 chloroplastic [Bienertia sinuspersici]
MIYSNTHLYHHLDLKGLIVVPANIVIRVLGVMEFIAILVRFGKIEGGECMHLTLFLMVHLINLDLGLLIPSTKLRSPLKKLTIQSLQKSRSQKK